jgi:hypothetical protein
MMRRSIRTNQLVRRAVAPLIVGCMALGVPAVAVLGASASASAGAATAATTSTDPVGPIVAQVDYLVAEIQYQVCILTLDASGGHGICIPPSPT